jgi:hypothetical protein
LCDTCMAYGVWREVVLPDGAWANPYLAVRRAASAHSLSFPYAEKDFVHSARVYSQPFGLASNKSDSSSAATVRHRSSPRIGERTGEGYEQ